MNRIIDLYDVACRVADFLPGDSVHFGMLVATNKKFNTTFRKFAEQAKKLRENTMLFVDLRDFIINDLIEKSQYAKEDDGGGDNEGEYNDESPENYWTMFYRESGGVILYLMRKGLDSHHVSVSASNFKWQDFDVVDRAGWAKFSPLMALPGPFKLADNNNNGSSGGGGAVVVPMGVDDELYSEDDFFYDDDDP